MDIQRNVTKHPMRTERVLNKLKKLGLIEDEYRTFYRKDNKPITTVRFVMLSEEGLRYVIEKILPKIKDKNIEDIFKNNG